MTISKVLDKESVEIDYLRLLRQHFSRTVLVGGQERTDDDQ